MARTFTEDDARRIFARVAEQQRVAGSPAGGLSLGDLEEAARAAGLDPSLVAAAAAEIDGPAPQRTRFGAPVETLGQRVVRGRVSDEAWEQMVATARAEFGQAGTAGQVGRTREWTLTGTGHRVQAMTRLALEPAGPDTRIVLTRSSQDAALGFTIGGGVTAVLAVVFATLAALGGDPELWIPAVILAVQSAVLLGGSQVGLRVWHRRQERRVARVLDRLDLVARDAAPADAQDREGTPAAPAPLAAGGRVDPGLLDDGADERAASGGTAPPARTRA